MTAHSSLTETERRDIRNIDKCSNRLLRMTKIREKSRERPFTGTGDESLTRLRGRYQRQAGKPRRWRKMRDGQDGNQISASKSRSFLRLCGGTVWGQIAFASADGDRAHRGLSGVLAIAAAGKPDK